MTRRLLLTLVVLLVGAGVLSNTTYRKRKQQRAIMEGRVEEYVADTTVRQYVDFGIVLRVVVADPNGEIMLDKAPPMRELRRHRFGAMVDLFAPVVDKDGKPILDKNGKGKTAPQFCGKSVDPVVWYCSEDQEAILLHNDPTKPAQLVTGSEGAGKTTTTAQFHIIRGVLPHFGQKREGGATAPTEARLDALVEEMISLYPSSWFTYKKAKKVFRFVDGNRIRMLSTHRSSKAAGSRVQTYNWSWATGDEEQDQTKEHDGVTARLRSAKGGAKKAPRLATATAKDDSEWRNLVGKIESTGLWLRRKLLGTKSPFIDPGHWEAMKMSLSLREYKRRVLAEDVGPELAVYYAWERARNLQHIPNIGAIDVTAAILSDYQSYMSPGQRFVLGAGHDPGVIYNTTEFAKLMVVPDAFEGARIWVPRWIVVGELQTKQTTAIEHARLCREYIRDTFHLEQPGGAKVAFFVDPHGKGEGNTDYQTHYGALQQVGIDAFNPAAVSGRIQRDARVQMANRLLGDWAAMPGVVRLAVAADNMNQPRAPKLVEGFEQLVKRPGETDPEGVQKKDETDKTHGPAGLAYLLWPFEQQAITQITVDRALAAAQRLAV